MAAPDPRELYSRKEWAAIRSALESGDEEELARALQTEQERADRLRALLAASLGLLVQDLWKVEVVGDSFGMTIHARARRSARIIWTQTMANARRIWADRKRVLGGTRGIFQIGGVPSSPGFRDAYLTAMEAGEEKAARRLLEREAARVVVEAVAQELRKVVGKAWRFLDTEYRAVEERRALERLEEKGVAWAIVVPEPGYCKICASYVLKPTPVSQVHLPPYHPNCRCKVREWKPTPR